MKYILFIFLSSLLFSSELATITNGKPWTSFIPIYGDYKLWQLNTFLHNDSQAINLKNRILRKNKNELKQMLALGKIQETDRIFLEQITPYIRFHKQATLFYVLMTLGSLSTSGCMIYLYDFVCEAKINECPYPINTTIPGLLFWLSVPFFLYRCSKDALISEYKLQFEKVTR